MTGESDAATGWERLAPYIDLVTPMAVRVAATIGVADLLRRDAARSAAELAEALRETSDESVDPDALDRLLRLLAACGIFSEPEPRRFALTELGELLRSDDPSGMRTSLDLAGFGGQMDLAFTELLASIRTGEPAWERVFGAPFWEYLAADQAFAASFDATMSAGAEYAADDLADTDWPASGRVVDVGGGDGTFLCGVLRERAGLHGVLFGLPSVTERAVASAAFAELDGRIEAVGGSFFRDVPRGGDLYVLNSVLHDWPDDDATAILSRCADAMGEENRLLIIDSIGGDPAGRAEMDLRMLVLCGGRERSEEELASLAEGAGLRVAARRRTPLGQAVLECVRAPRGADRQHGLRTGTRTSRGRSRPK